MLRIFAIIAPSTASSRSASSKIRNGALPPSSIETLSTLSAACAISLLPTSVEPVKESLRSRGSPMIGFEISLEDEPVTTFRTPSGRPHSSSSLRQRQHRERRLLGGLDHHRAAGGDRGADLARAHRVGEVPGGDEVARADRLAHDQDARGAVAGVLVVAVDPQRLAREPAEELGRVGELGLRLGDRLAHLQRHQQGEVVGALVERLEGAVEDLRALVRRRRGPTRPARRRRRRSRPARRRGSRRRSRTASRPSPGPRPRASPRRSRPATRRRSEAAAGRLRRRSSPAR